jgi:hypothetical protein
MEERSEGKPREIPKDELKKMLAVHPERNRANRRHGSGASGLDHSDKLRQSS